MKFLVQDGFVITLFRNEVFTEKVSDGVFSEVRESGSDIPTCSENIPLRRRDQQKLPGHFRILSILTHKNDYCKNHITLLLRKWQILVILFLPRGKNFFARCTKGDFFQKLNPHSNSDLLREELGDFLLLKKTSSFRDNSLSEKDN